MSERNQDDVQKDLSKERFGKFSQAYIKSKYHGDSPDLDTLIELVQPKQEWKVLDIATGGGHTALKFAPHVSEVIATDITPNMLQNAQEFIKQKGVSNVKFQHADAEDLPFGDDMFELVTCRIAAHHFPNVNKFVNEAYRVIKKTGHLLIVDQVASETKDVATYINEFEQLRDPSHVKTLSTTEWFQALKAARFTIMNHQYFQKEIELEWWTKTQECSPDTVQKLRKLLQTASSDVKERMNPKNINGDECSFLIHFILIHAQK